MTELYTEFIGNLRKQYGKFDEEQHRFDKFSNSEIARELGYSDAQFSRLVNGSATQGEYQRANQNLNRIIYIDKLEHDLSNAKDGKVNWAHRPFWAYLTITFVLGTIIYYFTSFSTVERSATVDNRATDRDITLKWAFETSYVKPYISLDQMPDDCDFPCYKFQGKWILDENYKLPFFREQNGYHYLATQVNMYARCMSEVSDNGNQFEGYEYQRHEIWYDKRELPVDSFLVSNSQLTKDYRELVFAENSNFVKLATVHTFFRNVFEIGESQVNRSGKVIGRDLEIASDDELLAGLGSEQEVEKIKLNINRISNIRLEDFSKPVSCEASPSPQADFHMIKDGDLMSFSCQLTTSRVALDYTKIYRLADQYIKNTCRTSEE